MYKKGHKHSEEVKRKIGSAIRGRKRPDLAEYNRTRTDLIGSTPWNKGLHYKLGPRPDFIPYMRGKKHTEETKRKISESRKGKGLRPKLPSDATYEDRRNGWALQNWARLVMKRDKKCIACGSTECLEAHHILPKRRFPEKMYDVSNGVTLCYSCHRKTDTYGYRLDCKR